MKSSSPLLVLIVPVFLGLGCSGSKPPSTGAEPTPPTSPTPEVAAASPATDTICASRYSVNAVISSGVLQEQINGVTFTDEQPFTCTLATATTTVPFSFAPTVTADGCTYDLSYVVEGATTSCSNPSGTTFSGTQTLSCNQVELDFLSLATPQASNPRCQGKTRLCDDPKIKLNDDNCG